MSKKPYTEYDEIQHIKEDLSSLKTNVVTLTQHLTDEGRVKLIDAKGQLKTLAKVLQKDGARRYHDVEKKVQQNPAQAVLLAFAGGMLASALLKRRG